MPTLTYCGRRGERGGGMGTQIAVQRPPRAGFPQSALLVAPPPPLFTHLAQLLQEVERLLGRGLGGGKEGTGARVSN